jgi:hypothetical protein
MNVTSISKESDERSNHHFRAPPQPGGAPSKGKNVTTTPLEGVTKKATISLLLARAGV